MRSGHGIAIAVAAGIAIGAASATAPPPRLPQTGVTFKTGDAFLQKLYDAAEAAERGNIIEFAPGRKALVEGGGYMNVWLETQPMGGAMYAKRDLEVGLNNQIVFMDCQRADGRLPGVVISTAETRMEKWDTEPGRRLPGILYLPDLEVCSYFAAQSGYCFPSPALDVYYLIGRDKGYLRRLGRVLEAHDAYLWRVRDSNGDGILELWCTFDNGEDGSSRFAGAPNSWAFEEPPVPGRPDRPVPENCRVPYQSMDAMSWSYEGRRVLAEISRELGDGREGYWLEKAAEVQKRLIASLWRPEKRACYDRDRNGAFMDVLLHNNLRCMWFGIFTPEMGDAFIREHLMNPDEFWTPMPLPSIAANDPLFRNVRVNNWSGQPQGLTYQRAIRALENYGHFAEVTLLGEIFLRTVGRTRRFRQQYDPFTGDPDDIPNLAADYGPTVLAVLEYISRMHGIHIDRERVLWSGLPRGDHAVATTQKWGDREYALRIADGRMTGSLNGQEIFSCSAGVRIVTDVDGRLLEIVGIAPETRIVTLSGGRRCAIDPNTVWSISGSGPPSLISRAPFDKPRLSKSQPLLRP